MIGSVFTHRLAGPIFAALAFTVGLLLLAQAVKTDVQRSRADKAEAAVATCMADLAQAQTNVITVRTEMASLSAQVEAWRAERDRALSESRKALKAAQEARRATDREIVSALNRKPQSSDPLGQCQELERGLRETVH